MKSPQSVTEWVTAILAKAKFRVCVGVCSGPKGPVIVVSNFVGFAVRFGSNRCCPNSI